MRNWMGWASGPRVAALYSKESATTPFHPSIADRAWAIGLIELCPEWLLSLGEGQL